MLTRVVPFPVDKDANLDQLVRSVQVVKVFYVSTGRNAWWSTWSTKYFVGRTHATLESAKSYCEPQRVQGTVFYIDELPSLAFVGDERTLVVSELNTENFMSRFDVAELGKLTDILPVSTMSLRQIARMFRPQSPLWGRGYPLYHSTFLSLTEASDVLARVALTDELSSFASSSSGPLYLLHWARRPFSKQRKTLHAIEAKLLGNISAQ